MKTILQFPLVSMAFLLTAIVSNGWNQAAMDIKQQKKELKPIDPGDIGKWYINF